MKYFSYESYSKKVLLELKKLNNTSIALVVPVLNEEKTLPLMISIIKNNKELFDDVIFVDSGSNDSSEKIIRDGGFTFIKDEDVSQKYSVALERGKGWNLWSGVLETECDVVTFLDSDVDNFNDNFLLGMVGPFLEDSKVSFLKGYYERPKNDSRVTEIFARPFLSYFYPKALEFIQPLSGEYGFRREFVVEVLFYSGYSVEITTLIQSMEKLSEEEIAQVYLGKRIHELQTVQSLGRMAFNVGLGVMNVLEQMEIRKFDYSHNLYQYLSDDGKKYTKSSNVKFDRPLPKIKDLLS